MNTELPNWLEITPGSTVHLKDTDSMLLSKKMSGTLSPLPLMVKRVAHLRDEKELADWYFIYFVPRKDVVGELLVIQRVDGNEDLYFYQQSDFSVKNRAQNIKDGNLWLFNEPADPTNYTPMSLKYTNIINQDDSETKVHIEYKQKSFGERIGVFRPYPAESGLYDMLGTFISYASEDGKNQALILELGSKTGMDGGAIFLYIGRQIDNSEVEVFHVK
jgi:hypothetical protein